MPVMGLWVVAIAVSAVIGYFLGSINFAILVSTKLFREDVRQKGSGNAGMTNVLRNYGKLGAVLTLLGDVGKGILAVWCGNWITMWLLPQGTDWLYCAYIAGICAIVGHMFPVFFKFKGGKGVSVAGGVILALQPLLALILVSIFLLIVVVTRMVSLGSVVGISLYPVVALIWALITHRPVVFCTVFSAIVAGLVVFMHRANIKRIINKTEYKFGEKKKT
ncbi:MAG: glycerol-3-phosphate 1-O-acyltransferase PlsY [Oscillospiraceae bacterium]